MELIAVPDLPEIRPGDDLAGLVADRVDLQAGDVVVVASTVVSKAEGRTADLADFPAGPRAREIAARIAAETADEKDPRFAQAVLEESTELLMTMPFLLTETRFGHVTVNAGIDRSNVPDADLLLLPTAPGESARRVRRGLLDRTGIDGDRVAGHGAAGEGDRPTPTADGAGPASGRDVQGIGAETPDGVDGLGVVVSDTSGRPFRTGQRGVAVGWAGLPPTRDWRGDLDRDGRELAVTVEAVVDELAAAANLVAGEGAGGTPAVVVRDWAFGDHDGGERLFRDVDSDFVRQALRDWTFDPERVPAVEDGLASVAPAAGHSHGHDHAHDGDHDHDGDGDGHAHDHDGDADGGHGHDHDGDADGHDHDRDYDGHDDGHAHDDDGDGHDHDAHDGDGHDHAHDAHDHDDGHDHDHKGDHDDGHGDAGEGER